MIPNLRVNLRFKLYWLHPPQLHIRCAQVRVHRDAGGRGGAQRQHHAGQDLLPPGRDPLGVPLQKLHSLRQKRGGLNVNLG